MKKLFGMTAVLLSLLLGLTSCGGLFGLGKGDEVVLEYDVEEMQANMDRIKNEDGILIELTVTSIETGQMAESEKMTYAETRNYFYYHAGEQELYMDFSDVTKAVTYTKNSEGVWEKYDTVYADTGLTREQLEAQNALYTAGFFGYLGNYSQFAGQSMKKSSETVAGRECDKFSLSVGAFGYGINYAFAIDRETGMCLKWEYGASAGMEGSASVSFTCTKFETPYTVTLPENAIDVTPGNSGQIDINDILSGNLAENIIYGEMDAASKQQMIADAQEMGVEISFGADGSTTVREPDGTMLVQHPDGSWTVTDPQGGVTEVVSGWPDNEFTAVVPKPDIPITTTAVEGNAFFAVLAPEGIDDVRVYANALKEAGFTVNEQVEDTEMSGIVIYSFSASNASGYHVEFSYAMGVCSLNISKT